MKSPRPGAVPDEPVRPAVPAASRRPRAIRIEDHLERRVRKPVDLLRFIGCWAGVVLLGAFGIVASATTTGVETNIVEFSRRMPYTAFTTARSLVLFALLILPVALAVRQLVRRQGQRLWEAALTGLFTFVAVSVADTLLRSGAATQLYDAIVMARPGVSHMTALDGYLAGLAAFTTMIGLSGRQRWQAAMWLVVGGYALVNLAAGHTTVLSLLMTLLIGRAIGLGVRYAAGVMSLRPTAEQIAAALSTVGCELTEMRRAAPAGGESRHYAAAARGGARLDVFAYDQDQEAAGAFYRLYRMVRLQTQVSHSTPLSVDRTVERRALLSYAAQNAGAPTPRLRGLTRAGPEAVALAFDHYGGCTLAETGGAPSAAELSLIWDAVRQLHENRVTHGALTADRILLTDAGGVMLLDMSSGEVAATDLEIRLDLVQFLCELAVCAGPEAVADLVVSKVDSHEVAAVVPLLQTVVLAPVTKAALSHSKEILPELRKRLLATVPGGEVAPVRLERIRLRTLVTLVATVAAVYLLAGELARASLASVLRSADWSWGIVALALSALTYVGATWSLTGYVTERLSFVRTLLAQVAGSFVTLVTPAAVGGAALNIRYLQRRKVPAPVAAVTVGVSQVVAFVLHILLLVIFVAVTGAAQSHPFRPPEWIYFVLAAIVAAALAVLALPAGRRLLRARLAPPLGQVVPRLLQLAQQPRKLAQGIGGALLLSASYILCLDVCVRALGGSASLASVAVVYLTGSAIGSIVPTPGGLGAVEAALSAGLRATGLAGAVAVGSVLLFRLLTFWLPVPVGWAALRYLEREQAL
ncbi:MAG TPA: lysylphosphatidylglycerol synthase domain-containing protein [Streptosporangiaceae bacterium]|nr:lysylphosphatidylglycerol synthase domain-containing protein [Streptosporangiaceae bacterium]